MTDKMPDFGDLVENDLLELPDWMFEGFDTLWLGMKEVPRYMHEAWFERYDRLECIEEESPANILSALTRELGSSARLQWLAVHYDDMSDETLRAILPSLWVDPNMLAPPRGFSALKALEILERVGFISDGAAVRPTAAKHVYHGVIGAEYEPDWEDWSSLCWTSSKKVALKFATYSGVVLHGIIAPEHVLARFDARGEHEWVLDPRRLSYVERIEHGEV